MERKQKDLITLVAVGDVSPDRADAPSIFRHGGDLHRKADVVAQTEYRDGETPVAGTMVAKQTPVVPAHEPAVTRITKINSAPAGTAVAQTAPRTEPAPFIRPARFSPSIHEVTIPFTKPAPAESQYDEEFRRVHGTDYDPTSPVDRRKMDTLKHALLVPREPAPARTF